MEAKETIVPACRLCSSAENQAEISFKAGYDKAMLEAGRANGLALMEGKEIGRQEVVEWLENREKHYTNPHFKYDSEWQAKLREWGIK